VFLSPQGTQGGARITSIFVNQYSHWVDIFESSFNDMQKNQFRNLQLWQFDSLAKETAIHHFVTDRRSNPEGHDFTLSLSSSPDKDMIRSNRSLLAEAMGIKTTELYLPSQIHKTRIVNVTRQTPKDEMADTDALICGDKGICIAVMSADCVPILLYDKKNRAVGAVHSGWRGTVARILEKTLQQMKNDFGTQGKDIIAGIGPSVSQASYEVGEEVVHEVRQAFGNDSDLMIAQPANKAKLDLWKANKLQLIEFGVPESQIEISDLCTVIHNQHFFSARKGDAGRFAAGIMVRG
jgi:YfiH family protein